MPRCNVHTDFFDDSCEACRQEYMEMKGAGEHVEEEKEKEEKKYKVLKFPQQWKIAKQGDVPTSPLTPSR